MISYVYINDSERHCYDERQRRFLLERSMIRKDDGKSETGSFNNFAGIENNAVYRFLRTGIDGLLSKKPKDLPVWQANAMLRLMQRQMTREEYHLLRRSATGLSSIGYSGKVR